MSLAASLMAFSGVTSVRLTAAPANTNSSTSDWAPRTEPRGRGSLASQEEQQRLRLKWRTLIVLFVTGIKNTRPLYLCSIQSSPLIARSSPGSPAFNDKNNLYFFWHKSGQLTCKMDGHWGESFVPVTQSGTPQCKTGWSLIIQHWYWADVCSFKHQCHRLCISASTIHLMHTSG